MGDLNARNSIEQEETSILMATESKPSEWTDAKHSLFLKSMEATFVDNLYKSLDMFHKNCPSASKSSKHKQTTIQASSHEHLSCLQRQGIRKFQGSRPRAPSRATDYQENSAESNTEVTGQNFVDDDLQEENSDRTQRRKRTRTLASCNDQVVPSGNIVRTE